MANKIAGKSKRSCGSPRLTLLCVVAGIAQGLLVGCGDFQPAWKATTKVAPAITSNIKAEDILQRPATRLDLGLFKIERELSSSTNKPSYRAIANYQCYTCSPILIIQISVFDHSMSASPLKECQQDMAGFQLRLGQGSPFEAPLQKYFASASGEGGDNLEQQLAASKEHNSQVARIAASTRIDINYFKPPKPGQGISTQWFACTNKLNGGISETRIQEIDVDDVLSRGNKP